jgi:hypothetical protein
MKKMTWIPFIVGALLLVIALPVFADDISQIGADSSELQSRIENASWNTADPADSSDSMDDADATYGGYPGGRCGIGNGSLGF